MPTVNTYLNFNGNTEEAFNFYKSVFGVEFAFLQRFKDTPHASQIPADEQDKIMHISLLIGNTLLMGTDVLKSMPPVTHGTGYSICIVPDNEEQAKKFFDGLAQGGKISMPLEKMFWGALFGMLTDKFGIQWMVNYDYNRPDHGSK